MRIISGKFKGKRIVSPKDKATWPLRDLVKESKKKPHKLMEAKKQLERKDQSKLAII